MDATRLVGILVVLVNFGSAFAILHQIRMTYRLKSAAGLSPIAWTMATSNAAVGVVYSLLIADTAFFLANLAWLTVNLTMLVLVFYYRNNVKPKQEGVG